MEKIKRYLKISALTTILMYLIVSFVKWDITWITEIGQYSPIVRVEIVLCYALLHCINILISLGDFLKKTD